MKQKYKIGEKIKLDTMEPFKVMTFSDGYYMIRKPHAIPCVIHEKDIDRKITILSSPVEKKIGKK